MDNGTILKLSQAPVFRKINQDHLEELRKLATRQDLKKNQIICSSNENFPYVLLIDKGSLRILKESDKGQSLIVRTLKAGDIFWGHAVVDGGPTPGTLKAAEANTRIYLWHKEHLLPILKQNPDALWEVSGILMQRMREASFTIDQLAFEDVLTRLAHLIITEYHKAGNKPKLRRSLTLEQMAAMIGTSPEVVCRLLYRIDEEGVIDINRNELFIKDIKKLSSLAKV